MNISHQNSNMTTQEKEIAQIIESYGKALKEADIDKAVGLYSPFAEIIPEGLPSLSNLENTRAFYEKTFSEIRIHGALVIKEIEVFGKMAIVRCEEPATIENLADGSRNPAFFREMFILKYNNEWKIYKYMFSSI